MALDESDFQLFKRIADSLEEHNKLVQQQNYTLLEILQQMKYLR